MNISVLRMSEDISILADWSRERRDGCMAYAVCIILFISFIHSSLSVYLPPISFISPSHPRFIEQMLNPNPATHSNHSWKEIFLHILLLCLRYHSWTQLPSPSPSSSSSSSPFLFHTPITLHFTPIQYHPIPLPSNI